MNKKEEYLNLLSKTYHEAVEFLSRKYGPAEDDYFREEFYQRFFNGEIKKSQKENIQDQQMDSNAIILMKINI